MKSGSSIGSHFFPLHAAENRTRLLSNLLPAAPHVPTLEEGPASRGHRTTSSPAMTWAGTFVGPHHHLGFKDYRVESSPQRHARVIPAKRRSGIIKD